MGLSALNAHWKKYHFIPTAKCPFCDNKKEDTIHYLLQCHHFAADRQTMLNSLVNILPQQHQILLNIDTKAKLKELTQILVFGLKENQALDIQIFTIVSVYIGKTGRFI